MKLSFVCATSHKGRQSLWQDGARWLKDENQRYMLTTSHFGAWFRLRKLHEDDGVATLPLSIPIAKPQIFREQMLS